MRQTVSKKRNDDGDSEKFRSCEAGQDNLQDTIGGGGATDKTTAGDRRAWATGDGSGLNRGCARSDRFGGALETAAAGRGWYGCGCGRGSQSLVVGGGLFYCGLAWTGD